MGSEQSTADALRQTVRKREEVLSALRASTTRKPELVDALGVSRSTVDRAIDALTESGLVRRVDGEYHVTPQGRLALEAYRTYVERTETFAEAAPLLANIPIDASIDRSLLDRGTIRVAEPHAPENAITDAVNELQSSDELLVFSPVVKSSYIRLVHEEVEERGLDVDLVLGRGASELLVSLVDVTEAVEGLLDADPFSLYETDADLPYMLYLLLGGETDAVGVTVHEDGGIVGSVTSRDPDAVEWARDRFDEFFATAEPVPDSALEL
jgi:predicted transcriptional regulator